MGNTLFDALLPSVGSAGKRVSASTQAGASCVFELRDVVWRKSSHALDGRGSATVGGGSASMGGGAAIMRGVAGRASHKASCALTRQTATRNIANATRGNIELARLLHTRPALQALSLMRPKLQAVRHFENRRQDAEYNQAYQNSDDDDDDRRNQLRDHSDGFIKLAFIHVRDRLHRLGEVSGLFAHGHHVSKQIRKELLLLQRRRERRAVNDRSAHLAQVRFEKTVARDLSDEIQ